MLSSGHSPFILQADNMSRFATISEEAGRQIIEEKDAKKTQIMTQVSMNALNSWMRARNHSIVEETITTTELDSLLYQFYLEVRKQNGKMYAKTAFRALRHGIQRYFKKLRNIDIINDASFTRSSMAFTAQCVAMKKMGLSKVQHKDPINETDMQKLYNSDLFGVNHPKSLQRKVFFELEYFFCRRAMENLRSLTTRSFVVKSDENGIEYVALDIEEFEKNHGAFDEDYDGGVMYATGTDNCPVSSFKKYISKLNPVIEALFQRPRSEPSDCRPWYDAQVLGVNSLGNMMKQMSKDAALSKIYTNHCIRATCISTLDNKGFEARHIQSVSGHKSASSICAYSRTQLGTKRKMSEALSESTIKKSQPSSSKPVFATSSLTPSVEKRQELLRQVSSVQTFDFAISNVFNDDDDDVDHHLSTMNIDETPKGKKICTSTPLRKMNTFNGFFGAHTAPVFNNCTFNFK